MTLASAAHDQFWAWFRDNGDRLRAVMYGKDEAAREEASAELREAVAAAQEEVVLEFGPSPEGGPKSLIVRADGRPERADAVQNLVASAPDLEGWCVLAFRPRMEIGDSIEIAIGDQRVGPEDVWFRVSADDDGLDLTLGVRGLNPENERLRGLGASLLAEHAVGERDAVTLLNSLQIEPLPDDPAAAGLHPFRELAGVFDEEKRRKYPPPGLLSLTPEGNWQALRGTIGGSEALLFLNQDLRGVARHPAYERRMVVTIPFHQARADGLPATEQEYIAVQEIGEGLDKALQEGQQSLLALTVMTQGRRDMIFYTSDVQGALARVQACRARVQTHRIETEVGWDTLWGTYRSFCHAATQHQDKE